MDLDKVIYSKILPIRFGRLDRLKWITVAVPSGIPGDKPLNVTLCVPWHVTKIRVAKPPETVFPVLVDQNSEILPRELDGFGYIEVDV